MRRQPNVWDLVKRVGSGRDGITPSNSGKIKRLKGLINCTVYRCTLEQVGARVGCDERTVDYCQGF